MDVKSAFISPRFHRDLFLKLTPPELHSAEVTPKTGSTIRFPTPPRSNVALQAGLPRSFSGTTATLGLAGLLVGFLIGRLTGGGRKRLSNVPGGDVLSFHQPPDSVGFQQDDDEEGQTPLWLNFALSRMWALFQKNTRRLIQDNIQPILDKPMKQKPDFVTAVRITKFIPGKSSPLLQTLRRLPSRALAEVQYSLRSIFSSTCEARFEVDVNLFGVNLTLPVTLRDLDMDATCWVAISLAPYEPFCTSIQYALLESPKVSFDVTIGPFLPITAVPALRSFFYRLVTKEIPKEFVFPNTILLDFTPEYVKEARAAGYNETEAGRGIESKTDDQLIREHPEQWSLFDLIDTDNSGCLSGVELFAGLKDWGYTAEDSSRSFAKLDLNSDSRVTFREFVQMWPVLSASFVPTRYKGVLTVFLRRAEGLATPRFGSTDPYVELHLNDQKVCSKRNLQTVDSGDKPGNPVWMEPFNLNCLGPKEDELKVTVMEGSRLTFPFSQKAIANGTIPLTALRKRQNYRMCTKLHPQGTIWIDLAYASFVPSTISYRDSSTPQKVTFSIEGDLSRGQRMEGGATPP